jgi:hypothetical protein
VPFVASDPYARLGEVIDTGHCMRHVQVVAGVTHSSTLRRGERVRGANVPRGTVVGTFDAEGRYANATDGSSHVAILLEETADGLRVVDQWRGQPVHERLIRFKGGQGTANNDGDRFHVVLETA